MLEQIDLLFAGPKVLLHARRASIDAVDSAILEKHEEKTAFMTGESTRIDTV